MKRNQPYRFRKLRIAWSVACGILCFLLTALGVRSHRYADHVAYVYRGDMYSIESACGSLRPVLSQQVAAATHSAWLFDSESLAHTNGAYDHPVFGWDAKDFPLYFMAYVPHWLVASLFAVFAVVPSVRWSNRFSLRTLLVATTVVAVILGIVAVSN